MTKMTNEEYVKSDRRCPFCGSDQIEGGFVEIDSHGAHQTVGCIECHKSWIDEYVLVGYTEME